MPVGSEQFNLDATFETLRQAFVAVTCHIWFDAAWHGLAVALFLGLLGFILFLRRQQYGRPLLAVCRKLSFFCILLMLPGAVYMLTAGSLPSTGTFQISSLGFLLFWAWISLHLSAEEMNFRWF